LVRAGSETDLVEELGEDHLPDAIAEGLVVSASRPKNEEAGLIDPAFARQALALDGPPAPLAAEPLADRLAKAIDARLPRSEKPWTWELQLVAPDSSDPHDPRRRAIAELSEQLPEALLARLPEAVREARVDREAERLVQVWAIDETEAVVGVTFSHDAITRVPGGRVRMKRPEDAPSRAGLKLEEAIAWIGIGPERGDICVDLGAAPGGWSQVAVKRGATVLAIDPARIKIELPPSRFTHVKESAFDFAPRETLDWLLCDMAWRPLEVALLVQKWGRRVWARQLIANFKLPMRKKAEVLAKIKDIIAGGGWRGIRARQLYFDRDEVTLFAWLDPNQARKGAQAPFRLRSKEKYRDDGGGPRARPRKPPRGRPPQGHTPQGRAPRGGPPRGGRPRGGRPSTRGRR
jgi:23S rRNA (cytidine2498-2'-O)-methyltransferase